MSEGRRATPEEQAAIDALGRRLDALQAVLAEDSRRWWARFEEDRKRWRAETAAVFGPAEAELASLAAEVRVLRVEREREVAAARLRRREWRMLWWRRLTGWLR
jgi:hypothetical protein